MTIGKLKNMIANLPNDARIYLDDGYSFFEGNSEVVIVCHGAGQYENKVVLQTKNDFDVANELEERLKYYSDNDWDELDAMMDMLEDGYTIEDFKYDDDRYMWAREFAENHGLI